MFFFGKHEWGWATRSYICNFGNSKWKTFFFENEPFGAGAICSILFSCERQNFLWEYETGVCCRNTLCISCCYYHNLWECDSEFEKQVCSVWTSSAHRLKAGLIKRLETYAPLAQKPFFLNRKSYSYFNHLIDLEILLSTHFVSLSIP